MKSHGDNKRVGGGGGGVGVRTASVVACTLGGYGAGGEGMLPSRGTSLRARVRLDVAAMLLNRWEFARETWPIPRYLAYYASPQRGIELFATVERVLTVDACGNTVLVRERRLP